MKVIPARPTVYRGIEMRSRLEARFAEWLDSFAAGRWSYEPNAFADETGQYLPDFRLDRGAAPPLYIELKGVCDDLIGVLKRMEIIWSSEPDATLALAIDTPQVEIFGEAGKWEVMKPVRGDSW